MDNCSKDMPEMWNATSKSLMKKTQTLENLLKLNPNI